MSEQSKVTEINGHKYSRTSFDGYKYRARVSFATTVSSIYRASSLDIYTTNTNRSDVETVLYQRKNNHVTALVVSAWYSKSEDDAAHEFINSLLID